MKFEFRIGMLYIRDMSAPRTKKAATPEQQRKMLSKRIGEQFKLAVYTAIDDLRSTWERTDLVELSNIYQTTENLRATADDKMDVRELVVITPAVYDMLWVLCDGLVQECNRTEFPAGFDPNPDSIAEYLDDCVSDAVTPPMIRFSKSANFGPAMAAFADPSQAIQNTIRGRLTTLATREILVAMLPKIFVDFLKTVANTAAIFVWYAIQSKPTFVATRIDEGLISAILVSNGFPPETVDTMFGGIPPKVKKAPKAKKSDVSADTSVATVADVGVDAEIAASLDAASNVAPNNDPDAPTDDLFDSLVAV